MLYHNSIANTSQTATVRMTIISLFQRNGCLVSLQYGQLQALCINVRLELATEALKTAYHLLEALNGLPSRNTVNTITYRAMRQPCSHAPATVRITVDAVQLEWRMAITNIERCPHK